MKKLIPLLGIFSLLLSNGILLAQVPTTIPPEKGINEWLDIVRKVAQWLYTILLILAVIFVLLAAFTYLTSGGDPAKVKKASSQLIYAVVAIVVAILAFSIAKIVTSIVL